MTNDEYTPDLEQEETNNQEEVEETLGELENKQLLEEESTTEPEKDWKAEALKYKAILARNKDKQHTKEPSKKSDDLDYGAKAFLKASGIENTEFDFVKDELKKSGLKDLESLLDNPYFKAELENRRELGKTKNATIKGKASNQVATDSVEFWLTKPIEEVPREMRYKVVQARMKKDSSGGTFYNS
jgi:hypothetical protein